MKENFEKLSMLNIDVNDFYTITFNEYEIRLQGRLSESLLKKMKQENYVFNLTESGWLHAKLDNVCVTLTLMP